MKSFTCSSQYGDITQNLIDARDRQSIMTSVTKHEESSSKSATHKPPSRFVSVFCCKHCGSTTEVLTSLPEDTDHDECAHDTHAGIVSHLKSHLPELHHHDSISDRGPFRIEVDENGNGHAVENYDWPPGTDASVRPTRLSEDQGLGPLAGKAIAPGGTGYGVILGTEGHMDDDEHGFVSCFKTQAVASFDPKTLDQDKRKEDSEAHESRDFGNME